MRPGKRKRSPDGEPGGSQESGHGKRVERETLRQEAELERGKGKSERETDRVPPGEAKLPVAMAKGITCIHPEHRS